MWLDTKMIILVFIGFLIFQKWLSTCFLLLVVIYSCKIFEYNNVYRYPNYTDYPDYSK